jgi:hypothetical protein
MEFESSGAGRGQSDVPIMWGRRTTSNASNWDVTCGLTGPHVSVNDMKVTSVDLHLCADSEQTEDTGGDGAAVTVIGGRAVCNQLAGDLCLQSDWR